MSERTRSVVVGALMILLLVNLIAPLAYHFMRPAPVEAQSSKATYVEDWTATKVIVSKTTINYYSGGWWWWWWGYWWYGSYANSSYVQTTPSGISGIWAGQGYVNYYYSSNLSPHGLVTEWQVKGALSK